MPLLGALCQTASLLAHVVGQRGEPVNGGRSFDVGEERLDILAAKGLFEDVQVVHGSGTDRVRVIFDDGDLKGRDDLAEPMLAALEAIVARLDEHGLMATSGQADSWAHVAAALVNTKSDVDEFGLASPWSPFQATDLDGASLRDTLPADFVAEMDQVLPVAVGIDVFSDDEGTSITLRPIWIDPMARIGGAAPTRLRLAASLERRREILREAGDRFWEHPEWQLRR